MTWSNIITLNYEDKTKSKFVKWSWETKYIVILTIAVALKELEKSIESIARYVLEIM